MSLQTWQETLVSAQIDGTAITNTTTATTLLPPSAKITLPNNFFQIGKALRVTASGRISNVITTPGTLILDIRLGAVIAWTSQAMALNIVAKTNVAWFMELLLTCRSIGASTSATLMGQGRFTSESVVGSPLIAVGGSGTFNMLDSTPVVGTGFDSTATNTVDMFAKFSVNTATTSIQLHQYILESLN